MFSRALRSPFLSLPGKSLEREGVMILCSGAPPAATPLPDAKTG